MLAVGVRSYYVSDVFRGTDVLLVQVDPWKYQVHLEALTAQTRGPLDTSLFVDPGRVVGAGQRSGLTPTGQDDLMVATLGWIAELFGGGPSAVGTVLATYPVVVGAVLCILAYLSTRWLTGERWAGFVAAGLLAITPANVYRTALGFGDHHAFDYLWLAVTFTAIVFLTHRGEMPRRHWFGTIGVLGLALAAQTLAWEGSPLLLAPYTGFVFVALLSTLRAGQSPVPEAGPLVAGLAIAVEIVVVAVFYLSWQTTTFVVLLLAQIVVLGGLVGLAELGHRYVGSSVATGSSVVGAVAVAAFVVFQRVPESTELLNTGAAYFSQTTGTVAEATPLVTVNDPVVTVLSFFGPLFILFVPGLLWTTGRALRAHRPGLLALSTYAWYFLALSVVQRRFTGELSLFFAVVISVGLVDLVRLRPEISESVFNVLPFGRADEETDRELSNGTLVTVFSVTLTVVFLISVTVAQVPLTMQHRTVTDAEYAATQEVEAYAAEHPGTGQVFSSIDSSLMYNYYAHDGPIWNNDVKANYRPFLFATDDVEWHHRLTREGNGFVVVTDTYDIADESALHTKLHDNLGSARGDVDGLGGYRLVYRSSDGSTTVYALVPGARLTGTAAPNTTISVTSSVEVKETTVMYERTFRTTANGSFRVVVPYPGTYQVGNETTQVSELAVLRGTNVSVPRSDSRPA
ncbi:STT3 domain-containing protein [Salinigranum halophilum]|uniref:STT3 domain-containing protein n=1 Tax=Salinigranum halophilum TaxID=2565931 RepID=UPI0013755376|nr:STT3 domain-containing protein [Salinigranum halophilum]